MSTLQTGAVVQALLAIANSDNTFWQGIFSVSAALCLVLASHKERQVS